MTAGIIKLNGKEYRIDVESYQSTDIIDFSPRASVPGNAVVFSELGMYQPYVQDDWRHGFGFQWNTDNAGYLRTDGSVDTRHAGIAMLHTAKTSSETNYQREGMVNHAGSVYSWGSAGIRKYTGGTWSSIKTIPPQVDSVSYSSTTGTSLSWSHTVTTLERNRILLVLVELSTDINMTSVTYGGLAMTALSSKANTAKAFIYYMIDPPTGANTIVVTPASSANIVAQGVSITNVNTTAPFGTAATASGNGTSSSVTVTASINDLVIDVVSKIGDNADVLTVGSGQTSRNLTAITSTMTGAVSTEAGAASVAMAWSWTNTRLWAGIGVAVQPEAAQVPINTMLSLGNYLFASPYNGRLRRTSTKFEKYLEIRPTAAESRDTLLWKANPTVNYNTSAASYIGYTTASKMHTVMRFDLSSIPSGATITSAKLRVHSVSLTGTTTPISISINRILSANQGWTATGATWNTKDGVNAWAGGATGCGTSGTDYSSTPLYAGNLSATADTLVDITLDLTEFGLMQTDNYGVVMTYGTDDSKFYTISTAEHADIQKRPMLMIQYTVADDWTTAGTDTNSGDYKWMVVHNGYVYAGKRYDSTATQLSNRVHYSNSVTLDTLNGTSTDTSSVAVGVGGYTIGAQVFASNLYISKPDGLYLLGDDKVAKCVLDYKAEADDDNFRSMAVHNGYLVFPIRDKIIQWNGARTNDITPPPLTDTFPYTTYGRFSNFVAVGNYLYCTARTNETTYEEHLLCFDGIGWFKLDDTITDGDGGVNLMHYDPDNNYLWINVVKSTGTTLYYIPMQQYSEYPYASFPTTGTHSLVTSRLDMGFRRVYKSCPTIQVSASNVSATQYISVYYSIDGGAWTDWGDITSNGTTELSTPNSLNTIEFLYAQFRFDFITATATSSPILEDYTIRFILRPDTAYGYNFNIVAGTELDEGGYVDDRSAATIISEIKAVRATYAPVAFVDLRGTTHYGYITALKETAAEVHHEEDVDGATDLESILNVNFISLS